MKCNPEAVHLISFINEHPTFSLSCFYLILGTCFVKTEAAVLFNRLRLVWSQLTRRLTSLVNIVIVSQRLKVLLTASYLEMRSEGTLTKYAFYFPWIHILHNKIRNWLYLEALELLTEQLADRTCVICLCQTAEVSIRKSPPSASPGYLLEGKKWDGKTNGR